MFRNISKKLIYLLIIILPFYFFFIHSNSSSAFQFKIIQSISIPLRLIEIPLKEAKKILYYHRTFEEYRYLSKEVNTLRARLTGLEEVIHENTRLEKLLAFKRRLIYSSVAANVIGREPSQWNDSIIIDKGEDDGIKIGNPVVNDLGVVGKIAAVGHDYAKVILLTDPQFSVAALVQGARESGLVSGTLQGVCRMSYLDKDADIQIGDKIITSKLSTSFPEHLVIGQIIQIDVSQDKTSVKYLVEPSVSFSQLEEVLVILN